MPNNFISIIIILPILYLLIFFLFFTRKIYKIIKTEKMKNKKDFIYKGTFFQSQIKDFINKHNGKNIPQDKFDALIDDKLLKLKKEFDTIVNDFIKKRLKSNIFVTKSNTHGRNSFFIENIRNNIKEIDLITLLDNSERDVGDFIIKYNSSKNYIYGFIK